MFSVYRPDLYARFGKVEFSGEHFSDEYIRVVAAEESLFQFFHLPRGKVGTRATSLVAADGVTSVAVVVIVT